MFETAVIAALIAAFASVVTTGLTLKEQKGAAKRQQRHNLALRAISYFDKGSQRRNVGISSMEPLWDDDDFEPYWESWLNLYCGAVVYVLCEGGNKTQSHELLNVSRMMQRLIKNRFFRYQHRRDNVVFAMNSFRNSVAEQDLEQNDICASFVNDSIPAWLADIKKQYKSYAH